MAKSQAQLEAAKRRAELQKKQQRQQMTSILVVAGTAVAVFLVLIILINATGSGGAVTKGKYDQLAQNSTTDGYPILGDASARFIVAEFSDFGCPFCLQYKPTINDLIDKQVRPGNIRFMFVALPYHQNSDQATRAGFCAAKQGKFWEMHDELFAVQSSQGLSGFNLSNLKDRAKTAGVADLNTWLDCAASTQTDDIYKRGDQLFRKVQAGGTPTMMWSTDEGQTWNFFRSSAGEPLNGGGVSLEIINTTIAAFQQGKL